MHRCVALASVTLLASAGLALGATTALADDAPAPGTDACTALVDASAHVKTALAAVSTAKDTLTDKEGLLSDANAKVTELADVLNGIGADEDGYDKAESDLGEAKVDAQRAEEAKNLAQADVSGAEQNLANITGSVTAQLCTGTGDDTTTTEPPADTTTPTEDNGGDTTTEPPATSSTTVVVPPRTVEHNHTTNNSTTNNTTNLTPINNHVIVNATTDDGSTATTSGNEVTDVPSGSAQTGAV